MLVLSSSALLVLSSAVVLVLSVKCFLCVLATVETAGLDSKADRALVAKAASTEQTERNTEVQGNKVMIIRWVQS